MIRHLCPRSSSSLTGVKTHLYAYMASALGHSASPLAHCRRPIIQLLNVRFEDIWPRGALARDVPWRVVHELGAVAHLVIHQLDVLQEQITGSLLEPQRLDSLAEPKNGLI